MRFAVFANPKAKWFRDQEGGIEALYRITSGKGLMLSPESTEETVAELRNLRDEKPEMLVVAGGDGTISHFTTAVIDVFGPDHVPPIGILHAGTMNTVSRSMGNRGEPPAQLESLVKQEGVGTTRRWPLRVGEARYGYLFGTGIIPRYIEAYEHEKEQSPKQAALTLLHLASAAFVGGAGDFYAKERMDVVVDGRPLPLKEWLVVAAGAVDDMGLGFRPFAGLLDAPGKLGIYATASRPHRFVMDLLPFRLGRKANHSLAFQHLAEELRLVAETPVHYNLDGELEVGPSTLVVRSGPPLTFLLPKGGRPPRNGLGP